LVGDVVFRQQWQKGDNCETDGFVARQIDYWCATLAAWLTARFGAG